MGTQTFKDTLSSCLLLGFKLNSDVPLLIPCCSNMSCSETQNRFHFSCHFTGFSAAQLLLSGHIQHIGFNQWSKEPTQRLLRTRTRDPIGRSNLENCSMNLLSTQVGLVKIAFVTMCLPSKHHPNTKVMLFSGSFATSGMKIMATLGHWVYPRCIPGSSQAMDILGFV